jgi:hypothetical protein
MQRRLERERAPVDGRGERQDRGLDRLAHGAELLETALDVAGGCRRLGHAAAPAPVSSGSSATLAISSTAFNLLGALSG